MFGSRSHSTGSTDPYNLQRFISAQERDYTTALGELCRGRKRSHWIWYIFPQVTGLGSSSMSRHYAIRSEKEALAFLEHDLLGSRLQECAEALLRIENREIDEIMGYPDDLKLRSSMTLFAALSAPGSVFQRVLNRYFRGEADKKTLAFLDHD